MSCFLDEVQFSLIKFLDHCAFLGFLDTLVQNLLSNENILEFSTKKLIQNIEKS